MTVFQFSQNHFFNFPDELYPADMGRETEVYCCSQGVHICYYRHRDTDDCTNIVLHDDDFHWGQETQEDDDRFENAYMNFGKGVHYC